MTCTPTRLELSNTAATSIQVTVTPDPGDQTTVSLSVPGIGLVQSANTTSGVALFLVAALTQSTNSLWDGTLQVGSNAPAEISVQVVETAAAQVVGVTVSGADVSYCAPTGGGSGVQNLGDLADVEVAGVQDGQVLGYDGSDWVPVDQGSANPEYVYGDASIMAALKNTNAKVTMIGDSIMNDSGTTFTSLFHGASFCWRPDKWGGIWHNIAGAYGPAIQQDGVVGNGNPATDTGGISVPGDGTAWAPGLQNATGGYGRYGDSAGTPTRMFDVGWDPGNLSTLASQHTSTVAQKFPDGYACFLNSDGSRDVATNANQAVLKYVFNIGNNVDFVPDVNINLYNPGSTQNTGFQTTTFTGSGRRMEVVSATLSDTTDYTGSEAGVWQGQLRSINNTEKLAVEKQFFGGTDDGFTLGYIGNGGWRTRNHYPPGESIQTGDGTQAYHYDATYLAQRLAIEGTTHAMVFIGENDVTSAGRNAATVFADIQTIIANLKAARDDIKIVLYTLYPVTGDDAAKLQIKDDLNVLIKALPDTDSDVVVYDLAGFIDDSFATNNAFFLAWLDQTEASPTHPNTTGAIAMMENFWSQVVASGQSTSGVTSVNADAGPAVVLTGDDIDVADDDSTTIHSAIDTNAASAAAAISAAVQAATAAAAAQNSADASVQSDGEGGVGNNTVLNIIEVTQTEYNALTPVSTTLYIINGP